MAATAKASRLIPAGPAEVWETLTSREGMKVYMMGAEVQTDWRVGHPITMRGEYNGKAFQDRGEIRSFEPWKRLSYTHTSGAAPGQTHIVTIELAPQGAATEVIITQENPDGSVQPADRERRADYDRTWAAMLEKLEQAVLD
jgi:uncharacterized protein YndB with AHSA1/START domain